MIFGERSGIVLFGGIAFLPAKWKPKKVELCILYVCPESPV